MHGTGNWANIFHFIKRILTNSSENTLITIRNSTHGWNNVVHIHRISRCAKCAPCVFSSRSILLEEACKNSFEHRRFNSDFNEPLASCAFALCPCFKFSAPTNTNRHCLCTHPGTGIGAISFVSIYEIINTAAWLPAISTKPYGQLVLINLIRRRLQVTGHLMITCALHCLSGINDALIIYAMLNATPIMAWNSTTEAAGE